MDVLKFEYKKGERQVFPAHPMVKNWLFEDQEEAEATLANSMARIAEKSGMDANDLYKLFPAVLRMLKNESSWTKNS